MLETTYRNTGRVGYDDPLGLKGNARHTLYLLDELRFGNSINRTH